MIAAAGLSPSDALARGFADAGVRLLAIEWAEPLPAGPLTVGSLPDRVDVAIRAGDVDLVSLRDMPLTAASFRLDDYRLDLDDLAGRVILTHALSPTITTIWSDGRFQTDGQEEARFWGTVSLELAGGAFITAATAARPDNPDHYVLDTLTITKGTAALIISGVGGEAGDMAVAASLGGYRIEEATSDGLVLVDGGASGWRQENERLAADAAYLGLTAPGGEYGPEGGRWSGREVGRVVAAFNRILVSGFTYSSLSRTANQLTDTVRDDSRDTAARRAGERTRAQMVAAEHAALLRGALEPGAA